MLFSATVARISACDEGFGRRTVGALVASPSRFLRRSAWGRPATGGVCGDHASGAVTPVLVPRDALAIANSRLQTGFITLNQLAGPPIGAALFAAGRAWPFVTEAVLVTAGVLLVSRLV